MNIIDKFVEKLDKSGVGACYYNEGAIKTNTGFGDGCSDDINSNKGSGRYNCSTGGGAAKGFNMGHHIIRKVNYNERHR